MNESGGTDWPVGGRWPADLIYGPAWIPPEVDWTVSGNAPAMQILVSFAERLAAAVAGRSRN